MAALVCDLCGGKLVIGSGGIATCDSCGMEHSADRMKEKVQEVKGVVQVDSSHLTENYMRMAQNAYDSGNKAEAESYCNKILETVPTHQQAWLLKGRAAGWQSTLGNIRFAEAINCFANAIANTEEDEKEAVINKCKQDVKELAEALIRLRGEHFAKWPDKEEKIGFYTGITAIVQAILQFFQAVGTLIDKDELMAPLATGINNSVMNAWHNTVRPTFANDHGGHPSDYALEKLFERAKYCTELLELAVNLSNIDYEGDIQCYKNLITINEYLINAQSYSYETVELQGSFVNDYQPRYENQYVKSKSLTEEAKKQRRQLISSYEGKIKKAHKDIFWSKYSNERKFLTKELNKCKRERDKLVAAKTGHTKIERLKKHISEIETILGKDRELTSRIEPSEKGFIESCEVFWKRLSSADYGYDAYLDQYPILKQAPELAIRREKLLAEKVRIETDKDDLLSSDRIGPWVTFALGILNIFLASWAEMPFWGFLSWVFTILFGIPSCILFKSYLEDKASIRGREERYAKEVREYNATIDKMLAVPKYEGNVEYDAKVKIPSKI